jgi:integrase
MARPKNKTARILGPYPKGDGFRIVLVRSSGEREYRVFASEDAAKEAIVRLTDEVNRPEKTVEEALREYKAYMRDEKGNKETSVKCTGHKLQRFFADLDVALTSLTPERCAELYQALRTAKCKPQKRKAPADDANPVEPKESKTISVDYHRNALAEAKTFLRWCVRKGWLTSNPAEAIEGTGKRNRGKEQLRIDEARRFISVAVKQADEGEEGAVAAMMTLLLGMRCSEVISRVARDVDDNGRLLWIPDSKTAKGRRTLLVPEELRPFLLELAEGKRGDELLFGYHDRSWPRLWVQKLCEEAGVTRVTAHGNRGLHGALSIEAGVTPRAVADALGHESFQKTTARNYVPAETIGRAGQVRALSVLRGGKDEPRRDAAAS